ncbi:MAG: hypothetical protein ACR2MM_08100 [Flavobacteriaceae bacterium]
MKRKYRFFKAAVFALLLSFFTSFSSAQTSLSPEQWQEDLKHLQTTVHQEYPFLFKKISAKEFDAKVTELHTAIPQMQEHEILVGFARLVAAFEYGHTSLGLRQNQVPLHRLPVLLYEFDDGVYLTGVQKDYREALGARLVEIEGMPIKEVQRMVRPVVPAENDQFVKAYGANHPTIP